MTCPHYELTNDGFGRYHYCVRCHLRVHTVMQDQFTVVRFVPCLESVKDDPKDIFYMKEKDCSCRATTKLEPGQHLV